MRGFGSICLRPLSLYDRVPNWRDDMIDLLAMLMFFQ